MGVSHMKKVAIGCNHGGFVLKERAVAMLKRLCIEAVDFGCYDQNSVIMG